MALQDIKTVILLMFENRSFDHMLGHLSYEGLQPDADGLKAPLSQYENLYQGDSYNSYPISADVQLTSDIPHEWNFVKTQLSRSPVNNEITMNGFVEAYANFTQSQPNPQAEPMGFFSSQQVPVTSFLARQFCTCDRWFSALPTSTQPNRTIAFFGQSPIYKTGGVQLIPVDNNIFSWMNTNGINWRVYNDGLSFFTLYPGLWGDVFGSNFKRYEHLAADLIQGDVPQVIIVEPSYYDSPHIGSDHPNDNHAPLAIGWGEQFLRNTYQAVIANPAVWANTLMVVYYDEHGGFYDHVAPPDFVNNNNANPPANPDGTSNNFDSLGPRIPAILVSPWVSPGTVCHDIFDHTSVLQFLAELFTPGMPYSAAVSSRNAAAPGIKSISAALSDAQSSIPPPIPPSAPLTVQSSLGDNIAVPPDNAMGAIFEQTARDLLARRPADVQANYPELFHWKAAVDQVRPL
jgi:phospholipase C